MNEIVLANSDVFFKKFARGVILIEHAWSSSDTNACFGFFVSGDKDCHVVTFHKEGIEVAIGEQLRFTEFVRSSKFPWSSRMKRAWAWVKGVFGREAK